MSVSKNLQDIIAKQKEVLSELERQTDALISSDFSIENERLKKELDALNKTLTSYKEKVSDLAAQNTGLKNALHEQIYNEKINIVNAALKKNDVYFRATMEGELNRLSVLEKDLKGRTEAISASLKKYRADAVGGLYHKLDELAAEAAKAVTEARARISREGGAFSEHSHEEFEKLHNEQITEDDIAAITKKNNWEAFVGGNLINKLGIFFVILGLIAVSRFTFSYLDDAFKGIIMFVISGALLVAGELMSRRNKTVFSLGLTSGGVAGLYASLSISYFVLNIISPVYAAIILCVLITMGALVLSLRYNSQTIIAFALIGGYIPIISIGESVSFVYGAMIYFIALNMLAILISFNKKWNIAMFIGFFLNLSGTVYICGNMLSGINEPFGIRQVSTILYVMFAFAVYTVIPILSNYRSKRPFANSDIVILGLNTVFSTLIMYSVFLALDLSKFNGLLALIFAVIYLFLGRFVEKSFNSEKHTLALFYLTGLTFAVLIIPFQFGKEWLSLGWLVQGVSLAAYGILNGHKRFRQVGFVICGLCAAAFLYFDAYLRVDELFAYKYFAMTLGSIIILWAFAYRRTLASDFENGYKYGVIVNLWIYLIYIVYQLQDLFLIRFSESIYDAAFIFGALAVAVTFLLAFLLPGLPLIADKGVKIISVILNILGMFLLLGIIGEYNIISGGMGYAQEVSAPVYAASSVALILIGLIAVLAIRKVLMFFVLEAGLSVEWLPFSVSAWFLLLLSQMLIYQYDISFTSIIISLVYVAAAFYWIVYGFLKCYVFMRRFGLLLSILAVAKLFLLDLQWLTQGFKIISYFCFGITLLGISFVYQYFGRRLIKQGDGSSAWQNIKQKNRPPASEEGADVEDMD